MKTQWMLLLIGGLGMAAPSALLAQVGGPQPMVVPSVTGTLRVQQSLPATCDDIDLTTPVTAGRIEITPAEGTPLLGFRYFVLTRSTITFAAFSVHRECITREVTRSYTQLAVELAGPVTILGTASGPGVYDFSIPTTDMRLYEAAIVNGESETSYRNPKEPVTGTIDLTLGTVSMHVVGATKIHIDPDILFGDYSGTLTADLSGNIAFPDADHDTVPDRTDNCPQVANPDQSPVASPLVRPPGDLTLGSCLDTGIGLAAAADLCESRPVSLTNDAPAPFPRGLTVVTWRAVDSRSRVGTATQRVTVTDNAPPAFTSVPAGISMNDCGPADLGLPTATDDCGGSPTFTNDAPSIFLVGVTTVTWTATDLSGNHATATQTVTVTDTVAPTVSCVPAGPPGGTFQVSASDHCALPVIRLGSFVLANDERIKINETGHSGVTFVGYVGPDHIRHFQVGKDEAVVSATDPSGNVSLAICPK